MCAGAMGIEDRALRVDALSQVTITAMLKWPLDYSWWYPSTQCFVSVWICYGTNILPYSTKTLLLTSTSFDNNVMAPALIVEMQLGGGHPRTSL